MFKKDPVSRACESKCPASRAPASIDSASKALLQKTLLQMTLPPHSDRAQDDPDRFFLLLRC
jgi:hypothetical protein